MKSQEGAIHEVDAYGIVDAGEFMKFHSHLSIVLAREVRGLEIMEVHCCLSPLLPFLDRSAEPKE